MKKTALAEAIEQIDLHLKNLQDFKAAVGGWGDQQDVYNTRIVALNDFKALAASLLPKEREQMEDTYRSGESNNGDMLSVPSYIEQDAQTYFDATYTQS